MPFSAVIRAMAVALVVAPPLAAQEAQIVPGTSGSLVPLEGFIFADGFAGFMNEDTGASVMIMEMPAEAYAEVAPFFADDTSASAAFSQQGIAVESVGTLTTNAGQELPY